MNDRVVIDDEADYATPNAKINKEEVTAINLNVGLLGDLGDGGSGTYIGVTATPARLDLNNTFLNESRNWVFLESHDNYKDVNSSSLSQIRKGKPATINWCGYPTIPMTRNYFAMRYFASYLE